MKTITLPERYLNTEKITLGFGDLQVESTVTFTIFGEVVNVNSDFLKLPEAAQKLICGDKYDNIKRRVQNNLALLDHMLPLIALDLLTNCFYSNLPSQFRWFKENLGPNLLEIKEANFQNEWTQALYELYERDKESPTLKYLTILLQRNKPHQRKALFQQLPEQDHPHPLLEPVLKKVLLVLSDESEINDALQALTIFPNEDTYEMLISRLGKTNYKHDEAILHSLSVYNKAELKDKLIEYYHTHKKEIDKRGIVVRTSRIREELLGCFENLSSAETEAIIFFDLKGNSYPAASKAFEELHKMGKSEEELVKIIHNNFVQKTSIEHIYVALRLYEKISNHELLPNEEELTNLLKWAYVDYEKPPGIFWSIGNLLKKVANENTYKTLAKFLDNNTEILKLVTLFIYGIIGRKEDIPMLKFLVGHEEDQVWKEASRALLKIENRLGKNEYFEELVLQLPHKMLVGEKLKILHQIKLALYSNPQPANLKSVFLKELELAHLFNQYDIKLKLLQLLGAVPDIEVAEVLAKYAQEQNNWNIMDAAEKSYQKIKHVLKNENK